MKSAYQALFLSCLVFLFFLFLLPANPTAMFADPDTGWHLAAGDLIRRLGHVPLHDSWSFTTGNWPWLNISWAWDAGLSYVYQHWGWHGVIAANSVTIAATLALVFAASLARSQNGIAAFLVAIMAALILSTNVRPYQISFLFTAALFFLLAQVSRRRAPFCWLFIVPAMMAVWVNVHGGFLTAFLLLGFYALDALLQKDYHLFIRLAAAGIASLAACLINPYGIRIINATWRTLGSPIRPFIQEWGPLELSADNFLSILYILFFLVLVTMRRTPALRSEKWIAYVWLLMGFISIRALSVFGIVSAPMLAVGLRDVMQRRAAPRERSPLAEKICALSLRVVETRAASIAALAVALAGSAWLATPQAARLYDTLSFNPIPDLSPEVAFLEDHYPQARLFNSYSLGGPLIFYGRGKIPVWIDGRADTAYPPQVINDYIAFARPQKDWDRLFDRWHIDGAIISPLEPMAMDRFVSRKGWRLVFKGKDASIFMRDRY